MRQLRPPVLLALAALAGAAWGALAGWWTPRGPVTAAQALACVGVSLAVGLVGGWLSGSRWAMLLTPAAFVVALELVRIGHQGPTVDAPRLSAFGFAALLFGRGVHVLFTGLPMLVGAAYGAGIARRRAGIPGGGSFRRYAGRALIGLAAALVVLTAVAVVLPARTTPARAGGVAELTSVTVNGRTYGLMLRGADAGAPVLLSIPGPPGGSDIGAMRTYLSGLERHFVVATWDRRGGAKSYGALEPASTFTMDNEVSDALGVADYLRGRFHQSRIVLVGHSGGSLVGVLAAQRQPSWFRAYVGVGQAVDVAESDVLQYGDTLAWARRTGNDALAKRLTDLGPPPYDNFLSYEPIQANEGSVYPYDRGPAADPTAGAGVPEYSLLEKIHYFAGTFDAFDILYPRYQDVDLRVRVPRLEVPVRFVMGAHEVPGRLQALQQWYGQLRAPDKDLVVFDRSGHRPQFEQPDRFVEVMRRLLAETSG